MDIGKLLIISGGILVLIGIAYSLGLGKLPGDIVVKRENFSFYFPIATMIIVSVVLTIALNLFFRR